MYIKRALFTNFGRHRSLDLNFQHGLVGIIGPNGSGKSTIIDGIYAAITNDFKRFDGVKADSINLDAGPGEISSIDLWIEHQGVELELHRGLRPANSWLKVDGKKFDKAADIENMLREKLGFDLDILDGYVFVGQWKIFDFLDQRPGQRAASYQLLCGTTKAADICDAIDKHLKTDTSLSTTIIDNSDELRAQLGSKKEELAVVENALKAEQGKLLLRDTHAKATEIKEKYAKYTQANSTLPELQNKLAATLVAHNAAQKQKQEMTQQAAEAKQLLDELMPQVEVARTQRQQWVNYRAYTAQLNDAEARTAKCLGKLNEVVARKVAPHPKRDSLEAYRETVTLLRRQITEDQSLLTTFASAGIAACPTCRTPTTQIAPLIETKRKELPGLQKQLTELSDFIAAIQDMDQAVKRYDEEYRKCEGYFNQAKAVLDELKQKAVDKPTSDEEAIDQVFTDLSIAQEVSANAASMLLTATNAEAQLSERLRTYQETVNNVEATVKANKVDENVYRRAEEALARHVAANAEISRLKTAQSIHQKTLEGLNEQLATLRRQLDRSQKARQFAQRLRTIKDEIMHCQALPQQVAQSNLQSMEADINAELANFGSPFWVEVADDLSFIAHPSGGAPHAAGRLSGGQKSVLAICFRTAMCVLFEAQLDLLTLDEPTAGMDAENVQFLSEALKQYAAKVRGSRQVFLITHAHELRNSFDQVVELGVANA